MNEILSKSIPLLALELVSPGATKDPSIKSLGLLVGNRVEVDIAGLYLYQPELAAKAEKYWNSQKDFFDNIGQGDKPALKVKRTILLTKQQDNQNGRKDLKIEINKLLKTSWGGEIKELLSNSPDFISLSKKVSMKSGSLDVDGVWSTLTFSLPARTSWDTELGGYFSPGELEREFILTVNHAPWRDRKNRRLTSLKISAIEVWSKP